MTLGNRIKSLRVAAGLSQPEFADKAGIEQSYLSKLENDKSIPSNDIFRQLLDAFQMSVDTFMSGISLQSEAGRVRQIADVEVWISSRQQAQHKHLRTYLYFCSAMIVAAITLFYTGYSKQGFPELVHVYESPGVVYEGEPIQIYRLFHTFIDPTSVDFQQQLAEKKLEMSQRRDEDVHLSHVYLGSKFEKPVEGGTRLYYLDGEKQQQRPINAWLQVIGVALLVAGGMGFVLERRLYSS